MSDLVIARAEILEQMNEYVINECTDEQWYRWIRVVPDKPSFEELIEIAEDEELWLMACRLIGTFESERDIYG